MLEGLQIFKGRSFNPKRKVNVYRNLHNDLLSVRQGKHVIGHIEAITIERVKFYVNLKKHAEVIQTQSKNVHAVASGYVSLDAVQENSERVRYNPYQAPYFRDANDERLTSANKLHINANGYMVAEVEQ